MSKYKPFAPGVGLRHSPDSDSSFKTSSSGYGLYKQVEKALVTDVILDPSADGVTELDVGMIYFQFFGEKGNDSFTAKNIARPINKNIQVFPVKNEVVLIITDDDTHWYLPPLGTKGLLNNNAEFGILDRESVQDGGAQGDDSGVPNSSEEGEYELGEYFESLDNIPHLLPFEGDTLIQGRFGNYIRLGSNPVEQTLTPNMKISLRSEFDDTNFHIHEETLDDYDCIWITTDETLEFVEKSIPITGDGDTVLKSNTEDVWKGRQIAIFSDRIIFQSKEQEIVGYSNLGIHWSCNKNYSIDSDDKIIFNSKNNIEYNTQKEHLSYAKENYSVTTDMKYLRVSKDNSEIITNKQFQVTSDAETQIQALKVMIGKFAANEPLICGNMHQAILEKMLDILAAHIHPTGTGPSGPPVQAGQLTALKPEFKETLSVDNFTTKTNG